MRTISVAAGCACMTVAAPSAAQISGSAAVATDLRFRGRSVTAGRPAATASLSYDDASGIYLNGYAVAADAEDDGIGLIGGQANIGYARQIGDALSLDTGFMRTRWPRYRITSAATDYDELYVGLAGRRLSTYLYVSPGSRDNPLAYAQVTGALPAGPDWRITGHAGLSFLPAGMADRSAYDIDIGLTRRVGAIDYRISWSAAEPYRRTSTRSRIDHAMVLGVAYMF